jgi:transmembrane sensor
VTTPDSILDDYRTAWTAAPTGIDAHAVWSRIDAATRPVEAAPARILPTWLRYAAAASVLLAGMLLLVRHVSSPEPLRYEAAREMTRHVLPDGSDVVLRPHSRLVVMGAADGSVRYRLEGEAWFQVAHGERLFEVVTASGDIRVHGTRFNVRTWSGGTSVYLESGSVSFSNAMATVLLEPGHVAKSEGDRTPISVDRGRTEVYLAWTRGEMILDATPVSDVLLELGQHYGVVLAAPDSVLHTPVSGRFVLGDLQRTVDALSLTTGHPIRRSNP